ncbi:hypothetical protein [Pseudogemmobacter faecipullorum]|uniref:Uncharacterized protein n=1 Tax=Pseudogemmobacter faecipullorum TaxID=2755041 RepID=A0ABS8CJW8_9RHOB|nr:hypothetical protein [Pseudogemmobacter faecipullorum]MCB5409646.1 hypothetical protein [Pseudogemmobacter faecipullorum]
MLIWEVILLAGRTVFFLLSPFTENVNYYRRIGGNLRLQFPHRQSQQKTVAAKVMAEGKKGVPAVAGCHAAPVPEPSEHDFDALSDSCIDHDPPLAAGFRGEAFYHPDERPSPAPTPPPVKEHPRRAVFTGRIAPAKPIAIDEDMPLSTG